MRSEWRWKRAAGVGAPEHPLDAVQLPQRLDDARRVLGVFSHT